MSSEASFDFDGDIDVPFSDLMSNHEILAAARRVRPLLLVAQGTANANTMRETVANIVTGINGLQRYPDADTAQVGGLVIARSRELNGYVIGVAATQVASFRVNMSHRAADKRRRDGETYDATGHVGSTRDRRDEAVSEG